jgi:LacI family transcriptional regulator
MLQYRGIRGLIIMPRLRWKIARLFLDWKNFAAVEIGRSLSLPSNLHKVDRPVYYELLEALHLLKKAGYKRIGMAIHPGENQYRKQVYTAAYMAAHVTWRGLRKGKRKTTAEGMLWQWQETEFRQWYREYRPDVIIVQQLYEMWDWLARLDLKVPQDISIFKMNTRDADFSGFRGDAQGLVEACVDMLSLLLEQNRLGLPERPRVWLVRDLLVPGKSLQLPLMMEREKR